MILHRTTFVVRRLALTALGLTAGCLAVFPNNTLGQGVSWSGVTEGGVIQLQAGVAATNLTITASPIVPASPTNLVLALERQGSVILTRTAAPPYAVTFTNLGSGKYFLTAALQSPSQPTLGDLSFDISPATIQPPNDDWSQAAILSTLDTAFIGTNLFATPQANEPAPEGSAGKSVWWKWTASSSGVFTATTSGSGFDTVLGVYTGTNVTTLASSGANDDIGANAFSQVTFAATNGVNYYFLVDSATGSVGGQVQLRLLAGPPPTIAIVAPPDGYLMLLKSSALVTNVTAAITASDPGGIVHVDYWFDGGTNISLSGALTLPYQVSLTNLFAGQYLLTVAALNNAGLVGITNSGLSVISLEPVLVIDRSASTAGKLQMGLTGFKGPRYTLEGSTNLEAWCGVNTWTNFAGAVKVADTNIAQFPQRFYRATSAQ